MKWVSLLLMVVACQPMCEDVDTSIVVVIPTRSSHVVGKDIEAEVELDSAQAWLDSVFPDQLGRYIPGIGYSPSFSELLDYYGFNDTATVVEKVRVGLPDTMTVQDDFTYYPERYYPERKQHDRQLREVQETGTPAQQQTHEPETVRRSRAGRGAGVRLREEQDVLQDLP